MSLKKAPLICGAEDCWTKFDHHFRCQRFHQHKEVIQPVEC